tara:strand:- start:114 stop:836 length:723 start_codon:yes stop_codon:yes gene_type:complete
MKKILFILLFITPIIGLGQGLTKTNLILEEKKGFKDIQLGKNILEYYSIVNPVSGSGSVKVEIKSKQVYKDITKIYQNHIHRESQPFYLNDNIETWVVDKKHEKYNTFPEGTKINKIIIHTHKKIIFQIIIIVDNPGWDTHLYHLYKKVFGEDSYMDYCDGRYDKEEKDKRKHDCQITWYSDNVGLSVWSWKDFNTVFPVKSFWRVEYFYKKINWGLQNEEDSLRNIEKNQNKQKLIDGF